MNVRRHRLHADDDAPAAFVRSPNQGGELEPRYLVMHYTAAPSAQSSVGWLSNPQAKASAHLVIGRDGSVTQLVPFDRIAWHAGVSQWEGLDGLNRHSIGIELDNAGRLEEKGGKWSAWFGRSYADEDVMVATHKHESTPCGWHTFPEAQLEAALRVSRILVESYGLLDVVGHDDISPGRKVDPGPAFPLGSFRAHLLGRRMDEDPTFETTAALNIRAGPGTEHDRLPDSPLPRGTRLHVAEKRGQWRFVTVLDGDGDGPGVGGWVHGNYIRRRE